jgi:hypothetical protein
LWTGTERCGLELLECEDFSSTASSTRPYLNVVSQLTTAELEVPWHEADVQWGGAGAIRRRGSGQ